MNDTKGLLQSKTFWGAIIGLGALGLNALGYTVTAQDQTTIIGYVADLGGLVGGVLAIYGRIVATKKIGS